jgi:hypothetical protein
MFEVRREDDDELCGHVVERDGAWHAVTVFGGDLGAHPGREAAERQVREEGLASLAERWSLTEAATGEEQVVCIQQASPAAVTLALGYYSLPSVPSITLTRADLAEGRWRLRRR